MKLNCWMLLLFSLIVGSIVATGCIETRNEGIVSVDSLPTPFKSEYHQAQVETVSPTQVLMITQQTRQKSKAVVSGYGIKLNESLTSIPRIVCVDFTFPNRGRPEYPAATATFSGYDENGFRTSKVTEVYSLNTDIYGGDIAYYNASHKTTGCIYNNNVYPATYYILEVNGVRL